MTINEIFETIRNWAVSKFQPKGDYAVSSDIPTKISELENDKGFLSEVPDNYVTDADLNDKGYLTEETDPTVPEWAKQPTRPTYNKSDVGLENVDNTADISKPVSTVQQEAIDEAYQQATGYTNQKIADLINGAPETFDTLGEIASAMKDNEDVVRALQQAIGAKASQAELDGHTGNTTIHVTATERQSWNEKQTKTGDAKDNIVTFESGDSDNPTGWINVALFTAKENLGSLIRKASLMNSNLKYLLKLIGSTSLTGIGDGTVTGAISSLNTGLDNIGKTIGHEWIGGVIDTGGSDGHVTANGINLENNALYICTVSISGEANKDGGVYMEPYPAAGEFTWVGGKGAATKYFSVNQGVGMVTSAIFRTGPTGTQRLAIYFTSYSYVPNLTFSIGAVRIG